VSRADLLVSRPTALGVTRNVLRQLRGHRPGLLRAAETWVPDAERLAAYYGNHDELQLGFNFPFAFADFDPTQLARIVEETTAATVAGQRDDPDSVLSLCRNLLVLRQAEHGGRLAEFENLAVEGGRRVYRAGPLVVTARRLLSPSAS
jgi:hypothetical protein